jgi:hypothetical protein
MELAIVPSLKSSLFLKGELWPIANGSSGLKHGNNAGCDTFYTVQAG